MLILCKHNLFSFAYTSWAPEQYFGEGASLIKIPYPCFHHKNAVKRNHTIPESSNTSAIKTGEDHS